MTNCDLQTEKEDLRMTTLMIRAIKDAPLGQLTVAEIYQKLIELNPRLPERESDWKSTVRHTLSTSTLFVLDTSTKPGQWRIDPQGERSTHLNRKRKREDDGNIASENHTTRLNRERKRLGTTKRSGEGSMTGWQSKFVSVQKHRQNIVMNQSKIAYLSEEAARKSASSTVASPRHRTICLFEDSVLQQELPRRPLQKPSSNDIMMQLIPAITTTTTFIDAAPRTLPSQIVDTAFEPFPPIPRLGSWHRAHSQSSSITLSQSQSQ